MRAIKLGVMFFIKLLLFFVSVFIYSSVLVSSLEYAGSISSHESDYELILRLIVSSATALFFLVFLMTLKGLLSRLSAWFLFVLSFAVMAAGVFSGEVGVVIWALLTLIVGAVAVFIGSSFMAFIVDFLGRQFESLGNSLPSGRGVLLAEIIDNGYSKPQTKEFLYELSYDGKRDAASAVVTTFILYGIPFITLLGMSYEVFVK